MIKYKVFNTVIVAAVLCLSFLLKNVGADEIQRPDTNKMFSQEEETRIIQLTGMRTPEVFLELKDNTFAANRDLSYKAVYTAFTDRRQEALTVAESCLKELMFEIVDGQRIDRSSDFDIAKQVFEVFPDEATPRLTDLYQRSDSITRGNIIRVIGMLDGGEPIHTMLLKGLNDKKFAEEEDPSDFGQPMRVCDIAYNQIVLRYSILSVLRTISPGLKIDMRDYHIGVLHDALPLSAN